MCMKGSTKACCQNQILVPILSLINALTASLASVHVSDEARILRASSNGLEDITLDEGRDV